MLKNHLKDTQCSLIMCTNIRPNSAIFRLYNTLEEDPLQFQSMITNSEDLGKTIISLMAAIELLNAKIPSPLPNHVDIAYMTS